MSDNYMDSFFDKLEEKKGNMTDTHKLCGRDSRGVLCALAADYDALEQRCRELEQCMSEPLARLVRERDTLRSEVERLRLKITEQPDTVKVPREQLEFWANDLALHGVGDIETAQQVDALLGKEGA